MIEELKRDLNVADEDARKSSHDVISYKTKGGRNNGILTKNRQAESRIKALEEDTSFVDKAFARDDNFGVEDDNILGTITEDKFPSVQLLNFNDKGALDMVKDHNNNNKNVDDDGGFSLTRDDMKCNDEFSNTQQEDFDRTGDDELDCGMDDSLKREVGLGSSGANGYGNTDDFVGDDGILENEFDGDYEEDGFEVGNEDDEYDEEF